MHFYVLLSFSDPSIPSIFLINLININNFIFNLDATVKDSLPFTQYTMFYTVKLNKKIIKKDLKIY